MIKIVSGKTIPVGSTVALVNLCNQFNDRGHSCTLYGPDRWHLDKCSAAAISDFHPETGDIIIVHNIRLFSFAELYKLPEKIEQLQKETKLDALKDMLLKGISGSTKHDGMKLILSCQENDRFPIRRLRYALFDKIHCVDSSQIRYHTIKRNYFICPNFTNRLIASERKPERTAGVIGSIRKENTIELSVEKAFADGMETVIIYGYLVDPIYYYRAIEPLTKKYPMRIKFAGFMDDKQRMYDSLSDVYCAVGKPWSLVKRECCLTNTRYHGPDPYTGQSMNDEQIFAVWKDQLGL